MNKETDNKKIIDFNRIAKLLWEKRKVFFKVWPIVFVISSVWIFSEPRYYSAEVSLAPESNDGSVSGGGLSSLASSFGLNIGGVGGHDAIYPLLYPELFQSTEFIVSLLDIRVKNEDGSIETDYYTYMRKFQKSNWIVKPFRLATKYIKNLFTEKKSSAASNASKGINPFHMSEDDFMLCQSITDNIKCAHDKKTDVITITVKDQDPVICALLADSIRYRLQNFIIQYRTSKARLDVEYYQHLVDSSKVEYQKSADAYSKYCDSHKDILLQSSIQERDDLEADMELKRNTYTAMQTQLQAMNAKVQERTPAFTTLKSATVPIKPAGPKRMLFVIGMLVLSTVCIAVWFITKNRNTLFYEKV